MGAPGSVDGFRDELRAWLDEHLTADVVDAGGLVDEENLEALRAWNRVLADGGWAAPAWPVEHGGRGASVAEHVAYLEEMNRVRAAGPINVIGVSNIAPAIMQVGTAEQQDRYLAPMLRGDEIWSQGMSEPDAGSDLASLRTRASRDGDDYVITGHKVWTSYSDDADWCLVLARTDHDVAKHKGISAFAVPMRQPGVEQRPLPMINGITKEFGEVLFDGARVPAANMIGNPGEGWRLAMTVVSHEREPHALGFAGRYKKLVKDLTAQVRDDPSSHGEAAVRDLGWAIVEAEMLRLHVARRLSDRLDGISHGPEGSVDKLLMTWTEQSVGHAALAVGGTGLDGGDDMWLKVYLYSRAQSVMGGTSQIQRNLVASRILGLPAS